LDIAIEAALCWKWRSTVFVYTSLL